MKAIVTPLYRDGKPIIHIQGRRDATWEGELDLHCWLHPIIQRVVAQMSLVDEVGDTIPPLFDAACVSICADGMRFRGWQAVNGREVYQEWYIRFQAQGDNQCMQK